MANAWCINAIWFDWCLIQTLQQLDSSNIWVWVQFTAPDPLDDKRLDYIKYTDKCGCTCCLTNENEILIYATQWTLKNLTLTNDDTNEVVNVKRTDVFWSNRKKTVVRYKIGSAPVSITDWTLAVEELVQNQYQSSWYNVSWLTDWTTYYFTAFAVAQDDTIIVVQSSSITPEFDWQPTSSTIAYFKFETDKSNKVAWWITLSDSSASITILSWIKCLYIPWTWQVINYWFRKQDIFGWIVRIKWWFTWSVINQRRYINSSSDHHRQLYINTNSTILYWRYQQWWADINYWTALNSNWHCIWFTEDSSWAKLFLDWNIVWTNWTSRDFSTLTQDTWLWARMNNWAVDDFWNWYMWRFALFNASITLEDYLLFYNKTKKRYWIS